MRLLAGERKPHDLQAMVEGVNFVRQIERTTRRLMGAPLFGDFDEVWPGPEVDTREEIAQWVKDEAWGHHASCTAKIGADDDPMAVLDSRFRVRGVSGLRVVDASVFPEIPGFFIVTPIYMVSEKATDVILEDMGETRIEANQPWPGPRARISGIHGRTPLRAAVPAPLHLRGVPRV